MYWLKFCLFIGSGVKRGIGNWRYMDTGTWNFLLSCMRKKYSFIPHYHGYDAFEETVLKMDYEPYTNQYIFTGFFLIIAVKRIKMLTLPPKKNLKTWYLIYLLLTNYIFQKSILYFEIGSKIYVNEWLVLSIDVTFRSTKHITGITVEKKWLFLFEKLCGFRYLYSKHDQIKTFLFRFHF